MNYHLGGRAIQTSLSIFNKIYVEVDRCRIKDLYVEEKYFVRPGDFVYPVILDEYNFNILILIEDPKRCTVPWMFKKEQLFIFDWNREDVQSFLNIWDSLQEDFLKRYHKYIRFDVTPTKSKVFPHDLTLVGFVVDEIYTHMYETENV